MPYLVVSLVGLVAFLVSRPEIETPAFLPPTLSPPTLSPPTLSPPELALDGAHLGHLSSGATVAVSSYDWYRVHHPLFAIDGDPSPHGWQMWATVPGDRQPFIEVRLPAPAATGSVTLDFVGTGDGLENAIPAYTLSCALGAHTVHEVVVTDNTATAASHELPCPRADRVRVDFVVSEPGTHRAVVRLYEIVVHPPTPAEER